MKSTLTLAASCILALAACSNSGSNSGGDTPPGGNQKPIAEWQTQLLGQEGHGGDAIVCFSIPVRQALYQVRVGEQPNENCTPGGQCTNAPRQKTSGGGSGNGAPSSGVVWRMTDAGRKSIRSAKPLEQYVGERVPNSKEMFDTLAQLSVANGYKRMLKTFSQVPGAFSKISEIHHQVGWLTASGIQSEYGLMDINDSGLKGEIAIDEDYCKELQAVVRRDGQFWYDKNIVDHFDTVGLVMIQLHEELYAWAKEQDQLNRPYPPMHEMSDKTRRLILKMLNLDLTVDGLNSNLKTLGFSVQHWEGGYHIPTPAGNFMDTNTCVSEQEVLHNFFASTLGSRDYWLRTINFMTGRYVWLDLPQIVHNYPPALAQIISLTLSGQTPTSAFDLQNLQRTFEKPESCEGRFLF